MKLYSFNFCIWYNFNNFSSSAASIDKKEAAALKQAEKSIDALNQKVSSEVQTLYDKLSLLFPCHWQDINIIVLDEYIVFPPYSEVKVIAGKDGAGIDRVVKIVSILLLLNFLQYFKQSIVF